jgi:hypothetical protein
VSGSVKLNLVDTDKLTDDIRFPVLRKATAIVAKRARALAPRGSGSHIIASGKKKGQTRKPLAQTIRANVPKRGKGNVAAVATKAYHGWIVIHGTKPHTIGPRKGRSLVIAGHIIGSKVRHPGAKGQDYLTPAAEQSAADVAAAIRNIV